MRHALSGAGSVTRAIYDAGFNSSGRFYDKSAYLLGMTPTRYRARGTQEELRFASGQSLLGAILVASSARGVASILIGDVPDGLARDLQVRFPKAPLIGGRLRSLGRAGRLLRRQPGLDLDLPLDVRGTAFQRRVWQALRGHCQIKFTSWRLVQRTRAVSPAYPSAESAEHSLPGKSGQ